MRVCGYDQIQRMIKVQSVKGLIVVNHRSISSSLPSTKNEQITRDKD